MPAFWRWKGKLGEGVDIPALTAHIDLYKTFCDLAGAKIPDGIQQIDGRSLLPLLENPQAKWADRYLFVHQGRWAKGSDPNDSKFDGCAVRTQRWRLVNNKELYDISVDPYEKQDVASEHPEVVAEMRTAYDDWWAETLPLMVNEDAPYAAAATSSGSLRKATEGSWDTELVSTKTLGTDRTGGPETGEPTVAR